MAYNDTNDQRIEKIYDIADELTNTLENEALDTLHIVGAFLPEMNVETSDSEDQGARLVFHFEVPDELVQLVICSMLPAAMLARQNYGFSQEETLKTYVGGLRDALPPVMRTELATALNTSIDMRTESQPRNRNERRRAQRRKKLQMKPGMLPEKDPQRLSIWEEATSACLEELQRAEPGIACLLAGSLPSAQDRRQPMLLEAHQVNDPDLLVDIALGGLLASIHPENPMEVLKAMASIGANFSLALEEADARLFASLLEEDLK